MTNDDLRFKLRGQQYDEATFVMQFNDHIEPNFRDYSINGEKLELGKYYAVEKDRLVDSGQFNSATQHRQFSIWTLTPTLCFFAFQQEITCQH